jgi:hypothetical protein
MPLSRDDQAVFEHLADAGALYDRYLEIAKVAQIPSDEETHALMTQVPPRTDFPLTLEIRTHG